MGDAGKPVPAMYTIPTTDETGLLENVREKVKVIKMPAR
jgi:hypothetical protein